MMYYPYWLATISLFALAIEWKWPAFEKKQIRKGLIWDFLHLLLNGHFFGVALYLFSERILLPLVDSWLKTFQVYDIIYRSACSDLGLWIQIPIALFIIDFTQWCIHNLLHRSSMLWNIHKVHHSVQTDEMDWIVSFRFSWIESVIYKTLSFLPLAWLGFSTEAIFVHAVFGTLIGHLNHANLNWSYGPLRFLFNSPRMHRHHHDYNNQLQNFGIIFSCWDWIFHTAHLPKHPPKKLGFEGDTDMPKNTLGQLLWPLPLFFPVIKAKTWTIGGCVFLGMVLYLSL
jgi:sterol desaturase/sphingolipid hydroxylase (fatty acid hydroxylase superfamily)